LLPDRTVTEFVVEDGGNNSCDVMAIAIR